MKRKKKARRGGRTRDAGASSPGPAGDDPFDQILGVAAGRPFHSPFRGLADSLKASGSARPAPTGRPAGPTTSTTPPITPRAARGPSDIAGAEAESPSDDEVLAAALEGVERLAPLSPRVRIRRRAGLAEVEARMEERRREDLEALGRGDGFDVTFEDLYVRGRATGVSHETLRRLEKGEFPICAHLDLHGLLLEDARRSVDVFLAAQQKRGHRCVLLVTGKGKNSVGGRGVLREQVPQWLARGPSSRRVLAFASARPCDGGLGALVVLMRGGSSSKNRIEVEHGGVGPAGA